jgi:hypothetical protein
VLDRDDGRGGGVSAAHRVGAGPDGRGDGDLVDAPRPRARGGLVADDEHERNASLHSLGERRQRVGEAGAIGGCRGGEPTGRPEVRVGGDDSPGLMPHGGEVGRGAADERIEERGVAVAHDAEDVLDASGESLRHVCGHRVSRRHIGLRGHLAPLSGAALR